MLAANPAPESPHRLARMLPAWLPWRAHPVGAFIASAARHPERTGLVDDEGPLSFADLDGATNALAREWRDQGIGPGTTVGILSLNGRFFVQASLAAQKLGADVVVPQHGSLRTADRRCGRGRARRGAGGERKPRAGRGQGEAEADPRRGGGPRGARRLGPQVASSAVGPRADGGAHVGHHRAAEGRGPQVGRRSARRGRPARERPLRGRRQDDRGPAAVSRARPHDVHARAVAQLDRDRAPAVRPRGHPSRHRGKPGHRADRRAGDAAADARASLSKARELRRLLPPRRPVGRFRAVR